MGKAPRAVDWPLSVTHKWSYANIPLHSTLRGGFEALMRQGSVAAVGKQPASETNPTSWNTRHHFTENPSDGDVRRTRLVIIFSTGNGSSISILSGNTSINRARTRHIHSRVEECREEIETEPRDKSCHFCGMKFSTWQELSDHSAEHMENMCFNMFNMYFTKVSEEIRGAA